MHRWRKREGKQRTITPQQQQIEFDKINTETQRKEAGGLRWKDEETGIRRRSNRRDK